MQISLFLKCLWYNQRLILYPNGFSFLRGGWEAAIRTPRVPYEDIELVTKDKVKLRCYLIPHSPSKSLRGTVILFHGNAMNHADAVDPHAIYFSKLGFTVLTAEYRGYGRSEGTPSESGLRLDAQASFDFVANHAELSTSPIVVYGQSLGGAVAIDVSSRNASKISTLIVENTFSSIPHMVRQWPMGRFLSLFTTQKWLSASKLAGMPPTLPILMLSGLCDSVIPSREMGELWEVAKVRNPERNRWWRWSALWRKDKAESVIPPEKDVFKTFTGGGHNNTCMQPGYWTTITKFLDEVVPPSTS